MPPVPLVTKVHLEAVRFARDGFSIVLIGHKDHDEVIGTLAKCRIAATWWRRWKMPTPGASRPRPRTLSHANHPQPRRDPRYREPPQRAVSQIQGPPAQDICYATENRQMAVKAVSEFCDLLLVVGSQNSSNSKRLVEVGDNSGSARIWSTIAAMCGWSGSRELRTWR